MTTPEKTKRERFARTLSEYLNDLRLIVTLVAHTPALRGSSTDYDAYWKQKRAKGSMGIVGIFQHLRANWILPRLADGDVVAEFGCGDAATLLFLKAHKRIHAIGLDVSEYALSFAAMHGIETFRLNPAGSHSDSLPEADTYLLLEVLEHLPDPERLLRDVLAKTRKRIIVSVPNTGYFPYRLRLLLGRFPVQWKIHPGEHLRFWTLRDFRWWLAQLGLETCSEIHVYKGIPFFNRVLPNAFGMGILCEIHK